MIHLLLNHATNLLKAAIGFMVIALALISTAAFAQSVQSADWRQELATGTGAALARAPNGDYLTLGLESPDVYDPRYGDNLVLQRYGSDGQPIWPTPARWTTTYPGTRPYGLVVDAAGNTFVLATDGDYNYTVCTEQPCPPPPPLTMFDGYWLVQKYAPDGSLLWQRRQFQVSTAPILGVVDAAGDLYVTFDRGGLTAATSKLSGATGATLWTATTPDQAKAGAIAFSATGTVLVAASGGFFGLSINEYAQDTGARLTRTVYAEGAGLYTPGMAVGPNGEIAFTGKSANGLFVGLEGAGRQTLFTASTGVPGAQGRYVAFDALGRIAVAGTTPATTGTNWLIARYDATGTPAHAPVVLDRHASAAETPLALMTAADGAAYITGAAGPGPSANPSGTQAVTVRLAANGTIDWVASEAAGGRGVGAAVAADDSVAALTAGGMSLVHYPVPLLNRAPTSAISVASIAGLQVTFDASGSTDPDGTVASYQWTFGDGSSTVTSTPTALHPYSATGTYTASVVAVDNLGLAGAAASTSVSVVAPPTPTALTLSPTSVRGGSNVTGRVTLSSTNGAVVALSSNKPTVASVPSTVTVPAGSSSASFTIRTYKVRTDTAVTISATANGQSVSAVLTVKR